MSSRHLAYWYDELATQYDMLRSQQDISLSELDHNLKQIITKMKFSKINNVLDLGTGTGYGLTLIQDRFPKSNIIGLDFSFNMINIAKKKINMDRSNCDFVTGDINYLPFQNKSFDFILSVLCLHLLPDFKKGISKVFEILRPRGQFCFIFFGEEEFHKDILQEYIPSVVGELNYQKVAKDIREYFSFPSLDIVKETFKNPIIKKYSIYEYKKKYHLRTFEAFMYPLETRYNYWKEQLTEIQQAKVRRNLFLIFRKMIEDEGFPASIHSFTIKGMIR